MTLGALSPDDRCRPTCSRCSSVHARIELRSWSISNRFESERGVLRKVMRTFETRRLCEGGR